MTKKIVSRPRLVDAGGNLSKQWFVEFGFRDPNTLKMKRFRDYSGFSCLGTDEERRRLARQKIDELNDKLCKGWSPFDGEKCTYIDELIEQAQAERWGRMRSTVPTIRVYLSEFLQAKRATVIQHSYQTYRSKLRIFAEWAEHHKIDKVHVASIRREHICDFLTFMATEQHCSRRTILKYKQILHGFFDYLKDAKELISANPVKGIPNMGRVTDSAARPIPEHARRVLLDHMKANDWQLWLVCIMEYYCAIRPNELRQLRLCDIDLEREVIRVPSTISKNRLTEYVNIPKQLMEVFRKMRLDSINPDYYLFSKNGHPGSVMLGKNRLRYRFDKVREKLGLPDEYKLYSFKHTGGVELVNAGIDTWELQRHFRHKSIDTTERYISRNFAVKSDKIKNHFPDIDHTVK